jgi:hypothetical protein
MRGGGGFFSVPNFLGEFSMGVGAFFSFSPKEDIGSKISILLESLLLIRGVLAARAAWYSHGDSTIRLLAEF